MESFHFVTISHPEEVKEKRKQNEVRSHAIRHTAMKARNRAVKQKKNFIIVDMDSKGRRRTQKKRDTAKGVVNRSPSAGKLDPFQCLPASPERLRVLMRHKAAKHAGEPIFCVEDAGRIFFEGIDTIFRGGLTEPALFHALSLALELAANNDSPNVECLTHRGEVLKHLRSGTKDPANVSTFVICALLLLIGYEYRVDSGSQEVIFIHIRALDEVTKGMRENEFARLSTLSRALFWQDLVSCVLAGTPRFLSHDMFPEFFWNRSLCPLYPCSYVLRPGYQRIAHMLPAEMVVLLKDTNALCLLLDSRCTGDDLPIYKMQIDNGQAWVESRLADLLHAYRQTGEQNAVYEVCIFATYLCMYKLSTSIWEGVLMPEFCASQILRILQTTAEHSCWNDHPELVLWLLFVGGTFAIKRRTKLAFAATMTGYHGRRVNRFMVDWETVKDTLMEFCWSAHAMERKFRQYLDTLLTPDIMRMT